MKQRKYISLFFILLFFSCDAQILNNNALLGDRYHAIIWTIGDSNSRGNSTAVGTTPPVAGSVKQYDSANNNLRVITNLDLLEPVAAGGIGSQWPQAGATYFALTGNIPVFVNTGSGGSAFFNPTAGFSWFTNDTLYAGALDKLQNCLTLMNRTAPDLVIIELGINDVVQGHALSQTYVQSLIDRILTDFPGVRIVMSMPWAGSTPVGTYALLERAYQIRKWIKQEAIDNVTVEIGGDNGPLTTWGGLFQADQIHRNFSGNAFYGDKMMWGICQPLSVNKFARGIIGLLYNRISSTRIGWLDSHFENWEASGYIDDIDQYCVSSTAGYTDAANKWKNSVIDFGFVAVNSFGDATHADYDGYHFAGLSDADRVNIAPMSLIGNFVNFSTDFLYGVHVGVNATAATTAATQHGALESAAGGRIQILQTGSSTIGVYAASTTATTDGTETRPTAGGIYMAGRNDGTQELWKGDVLVDSDAVAAVALSPGANIRVSTVGNFNNNGTIQLRWAGVSALSFLIENDAINKTTWNTYNTTFLSNWLTNVP